MPAVSQQIFQLVLPQQASANTWSDVPRVFGLIRWHLSNVSTVLTLAAQVFLTGALATSDILIESHGAIARPPRREATAFPLSSPFFRLFFFFSFTLLHMMLKNAFAFKLY